MALKQCTWAQVNLHLYIWPPRPQWLHGHLSACHQPHHPPQSAQGADACACCSAHTWMWLPPAVMKRLGSCGSQVPAHSCGSSPADSAPVICAPAHIALIAHRLASLQAVTESPME